MTSEFQITVPASSANLGPGFDAVALALDLRCTFRVQPAREFVVTAEGRDEMILGGETAYWIFDLYRKFHRAVDMRPEPIALHIVNQIPIGKGLGSSAAARLAAVAIASHYAGIGFTDQQIFEEAVRLEGHPDNVAAAWWGGLVITRGMPDDPGSVSWLRVPLAPRWAFLIAVPGQHLLTEKARGILPLQFSRAEAVGTMQAALLMTHALAQGWPDLLGRAMAGDRLHQPFRAALCPLLPSLQPLVGKHGIAGVALSGAGPSVLLVLESEAARAGARAAVAAALAAASLEAELLDCRAATSGGAARPPAGAAG